MFPLSMQNFFAPLLKHLNKELATLTDNIFLNTKCHKQTSGNITTSISDHLPQLSDHLPQLSDHLITCPILKKFLGTRNIIGKEQITYRDFKNFNEIEFICDIQSIDWSYAPKTTMQTWV